MAAAELDGDDAVLGVSTRSSGTQAGAKSLSGRPGSSSQHVLFPRNMVIDDPMDPERRRSRGSSAGGARSPEPGGRGKAQRKPYVHELYQQSEVEVYIDGAEVELCPPMEVFIVGRVNHLQRLSFVGLPLERLEPAMSQLTQLTSLVATDCAALSDVSAAWHIPQLCTLQVTGCSSFVEVDSNIRACSTLRTLNVSRNKVMKVAPELGCLRDLQALWLCNNDLLNLPDAWSDLPALEYCDLSCNALSRLPESFTALKSLNWLSLENNKLTELPEALGELQQLTKLVAAHNELALVPTSIGGLTSLVTLDLSWNRLVTIPSTISQCWRLQALLLRNNSLNLVPVDAFVTMTRLVTLDLLNNKLYGHRADTFGRDLMMQLEEEGETLSDVEDLMVDTITRAGE